MSKPAIEYTVETTDPSGNTYRWGPSERDPGDIPQGIRFSTRPGKGFADCSMTLSRRIDAEYPDLAIEHECRIIGAEGQILWEGIIGGAPRERSIDSGDSVTVQGVGMMDDAARQRFCELLIDRDLGRWGPPSRARRQYILNFGHRWQDHGALDQDATGAYLRTELQSAWPGHSRCELYYRAPAGIGAIDYSFIAGHNINTAHSWEWYVLVAAGDNGASATSTSNLEAASGSGALTAAGQRHAWLSLIYPAAGGSDGANYDVAWRVAVRGTHGITTRARSDGGPDGLYVSDMLRYLWGRYYPLADLSGIEETTYPVPQAAWHDPTTLPDATAELNKWHGWKWGMWEGRKLEFAPHDFTKADWQVRSGQDGVEIQAAGDSTEAVFNGADVSWTDFGGQTHFLSARDVSDLRDESAWIPANQWGRSAYIDVQISDQMEEDDAIEIARLILAGQNRAKRPSVITVPYYIRNGAGDWRPVEEVRSGQTIAVTNQAGDAPRLITATDVQDHRLVISTDDAIADVETFLERLGGQRAIAGV